MKYKLTGFSAILITAAVVLLATFYQDSFAVNGRVHQHISAAEKGECTQDHRGAAFCTHLPLLVIDTGGQTIPGTASDRLDIFNERIYTAAEDGSSMISVHMDVFDDQTSRNHPTDVPTVSTSMQMRVRGHSSRQFEKAPYLIKLVTEDGLERSEPLLGMSGHDEWVLHGPYIDKSLIRNYVFYNLSGEIMEYAPNCRFCELIIDGDYRGIYLLTETVTAAENGRLPIMTKEKNAVMSGYLLRIDRSVEEDLESLRDVDVLSERTNIQSSDVAIRYPGKERLTEELKKKIENDFSGFEKALYSFDYDEGDHSYSKYIDVDSFINYYIINSVSGNADAGRYSTYIYKTLNGKYKLCVWDFNNCCNNSPFDITELSEDYVRPMVYFEMLFKDRKFVKRVISRYYELRKTVLSDEYLEQYIDGTLAYLGDAIERDSARWAEHIAADMLTGPGETNRDAHSQAEAVEMMESFLFDRLHWLDENIDYLLQFCSNSANKKYNELPR